MSFVLAACGNDGTNDQSAAVTAPQIATQPASVSISAGQTATFAVVASGTGPLAYRWLVNGAAIAGATSASYVSPVATTADNGSQYTVVVTNAAGSATSNVATLTVGPAAVSPGITTQPSATTVTVGQTATFSVTASGTAPLTYQWNRAGAPIAGANAASYTTPAVGAGDDGASFTVTVNNAAGTATSTGAVLTVTPAAVPPSIGSGPSGVTVNAGQAASFAVVVAGTAPLTYQWSKNGTAIAGATAASYTTAPTVNADDGARFAVTVTNAAGSVASPVATLTVTPLPIAPTITTQPASANVTAGQTATFTAAATGTSPLTYQWRRSGVAIQGANSASYTTPPTATTDSGAMFTVIIANAAGTVTSSAATLTVGAAIVAPAITTQPANATVTAGQAATFAVTATGTGPLNYQWNRNGSAIAGANAASYTTPITVPGDSGAAFGVVVSNAAGSVTSTAAVLTVNAAPVPPSITAQPASAAVNVGQTATFSVSAAGTATLTYQWRRNATPIIGATMSSYTTPVTTLADNGALFSVVVGNGAGSIASSDATLTVNALVWAGSRQDGALAGSDDEAHAIATDPAGNVAIVGRVTGKFVASDSSNYAAFVARYDTQGTLLWAQRVINNSFFSATDNGTGVATDAAGNVYATGITSGTLTGEVSNSASDVFVVKFDPAGNRLWGHQFGSNRNNAATALAVDQAGNAFVVGYASGQLPGQNAPDRDDYFITKYDTNGNRLWLHQVPITNNEDDAAYGVAVDAAGNAYVTGTTALNAAYSFIAKYDGSGALLWTSIFQPTTQVRYEKINALSIAVSSDGSIIYLGGVTNVDFDSPGEPFNAGGVQVPADGFVARFDGSGNRQWAHTLSSQVLNGPRYFDDHVLGISTNAAGSAVYLSGYTDGTMPGESSKGARDIIAARYAADGTRSWVRQFGSGIPAAATQNDIGFGIAVDPSGNIFVTGSTIGTFGTPGRDTGHQDWFVLKLRPADGTSY